MRAREDNAGKARSQRVGVLVAVLVVAAATLLIYPLKETAPANALGVVYLVGVLLVASLWGLRLGAATAVGGALAFNFFHIPPTGRLHVNEAENWVALAVFFVAAIAASEVAQRARRRADDAEQRRREADLWADMAQALLRSDDLDRALADAGARLAAMLELEFASIDVGEMARVDSVMLFPLNEGTRRLGTLAVPPDLPSATLNRLASRVVPALEALLAAAIERDELLGSRVEAVALRRSDVVKTTLLRSVSHDLRSPLTAILAAAEPLAVTDLAEAEQRELSAVVLEEAQRLSRLIDNLLDLSRLEANAAEPRLDWCDAGEVIAAAAEDAGGDVRLQIAPDLPAIRADTTQLERAFVNLLENATRHSGGEPVIVRAWPLHDRLMVRVSDRGPGIPLDQRRLVFEPFYRGAGHDPRQRGSGLGLAIVRGFVEANGGKVSLESSERGTSFVVEFPINPAVAAGAAPVSASA